MTPIPKALREEMANDPYYKVCIRAQEGTCSKKITFEHAWIYAGKQIQERWAIVPVCTYHHAVNEYQDGGDLDKGLNQYIALCRANLDDLCARMPKKDWRQEYKFLTQKYG